MGSSTEKTGRMFAMVEALHRSGISKRAYAEQHRICYGTLQYWCKRYRDHQAQIQAHKQPKRLPAARTSATQQQPAFLRLALPQERPAQEQPIDEQCAPWQAAIVFGRSVSGVVFRA
ncbi:MAG: hypothetical protein SGJ05_03925 [bacterium]|nr:hypothetical protein [bacterium]